ncbi:unnamed protein product [Cuscuta epithymum]|uniref:Scarecrow-like protein 14 n=1 Tax=Cuscuta epithymum TaxID=186058 RepID=A0AAV0F149_9ASTE|nr:unnamed protein product [Cuscuta epithymum]
MDPPFSGLPDSVKTSRLEDGFFFSSSFQLSDDTPNNCFLASLDFMNNHLTATPPSNLFSSLPGELYSPNGDDPVAKYLNQILLEENINEKPCMFHDAIALKDADESFSKDPPPSSNTSDPAQWTVDPSESSESSNCSLNTNNIQVLNADDHGHMFSDSEAVLLFKRGMEEANKFLPAANNFFTDLDISLNNTSRGKKHQHPDENRFEDERSSKQSAVYVEEELSEAFDQVLLSDPKFPSRVKDSQPEIVGKGMPHCDGKRRARMQQQQQQEEDTTTEAVDLQTLLLSCAQSVAINDRKSANEQLKQIWLHCSPNGDADQRLAYFLARGLEVRLTGTGTELYRSGAPKGITAFDKLKAYQVYMSTCPFKKIAIDFANKMIYMASSKAKTLHIIDFGIHYGFQWPILLQHLSNRPGGPPKLRFTGIDYPKPGFRPSELIEETGRRLAKYCERFGVPFEYNAIATRNWETIKIKDLKLARRGEEIVAVNCSFRFKDVFDEIEVMGESPRDAVLRLIRKVNPSIFVQAVVNGSYGSPFFASRFRDALYHYSSFFDIFDTLLPRDDPQRLQFEDDHFGREALNVIGCEGTERVVRPETYKQWQWRNSRAGFKLLPLNPGLMAELKKKLKAGYHKQFLLDEDGDWMVQGWKGRVLCASSCWVPAK